MDVSLTCPHCGYSRSVSRSAIPPGSLSAGCPRCRGRFPLPPFPEAAPVSAALSAPPEKRSRTFTFSFTGDAREYFGIWIVNTLLRIVTLGIYSPWAKVRARRYLYANTLLDDSPFHYLADPLAILRGWAVAAAFFLAYSLGSRTDPLLGSALGVCFFLLFPWIVVRSRIFTTRNSSHRNIRFGFRANYRDAYTVFAWLPLLLPFTLGFIAPYVYFRQKKYLMENTVYGGSTFSFDATPRQFYSIFLRAALAFILALVLPFAVLASFTGSFGFGLVEIGIVFLPLVLLAVYLVGVVYVRTALLNLTWNGASIGGSRFRSTLATGRMAWLYLSNAVAILLSLGLLVPWATVRMASYRLENLSLGGNQSLDEFAAGAQEDVPATGEEIADFFGVDLGF